MVTLAQTKSPLGPLAGFLFLTAFVFCYIYKMFFAGRCMKKLVFAGLLAVVNFGAMADQVMAGAGIGQTCSTWSESRKFSHRDERSKIVQELMFTWTQGYLSGVAMAELLAAQANGVAKPKMAQIPEARALESMMDRACKGQPEVVFVIAMHKMYQAMKPN